MALVLVERCFDEPVGFDVLQCKEARSAWCLEAYRVRPLRSWVSEDGRYILCEYDAPDAESVQRAQEQAGMPFTRIWAATAVEYPRRDER